MASRLGEGRLRACDANPPASHTTRTLNPLPHRQETEPTPPCQQQLTIAQPPKCTCFFNMRQQPPSKKKMASPDDVKKMYEAIRNRKRAREEADAAREAARVAA